MLYFENLSYLPIKSNTFLDFSIALCSLNSAKLLILVNLWLKFATIKLELVKMVSSISSCTCLSTSTNTKS